MWDVSLLSHTSCAAVPYGMCGGLGANCERQCAEFFCSEIRELFSSSVTAVTHPSETPRTPVPATHTLAHSTLPAAVTHPPPCIYVTAVTYSQCASHAFRSFGVCHSCGCVTPLVCVCVCMVHCTVCLPRDHCLRRNLALFSTPLTGALPRVLLVVEPAGGDPLIRTHAGLGCFFCTPVLLPAHLALGRKPC